MTKIFGINFVIFCILALFMILYFSSEMRIEGFALQGFPFTCPKTSIDADSCSMQCKSIQNAAQQAACQNVCNNLNIACALNA